MTVKNYLLVEGKSDESFFDAICEKLEINASVKAVAPKSIGGKANNKEGLLNYLPKVLNQLADGRIEKIAMVVDADCEELFGLGYKRTLSRVTEIVAEHDFFPRFSTDSPKHPWFIFQNSDKNIKDFGLWIMPGAFCDGILEDWIKHNIHTQDKELLQKVDEALSKLSEPKFKDAARVKAEVATWLAWQEHPGRGSEFAIINSLLDENSERFTQFTNWLKSFFN